MARTNASTRTVPCALCSDPISAARAACAITHGLCVPCNAANLHTSKEAQSLAPAYETLTLEAEAASYDPHADGRSHHG